MPALGRIGDVAQLGALLAPADEADRRGGAEPRRQRHRVLGLASLPVQPVGHQRRVDPLQFELADLLERVVAAERHSPDEVGDQDLVTLGLGAEARRLDHRRPEVVTFDSRRLPEADPDPDREGLLCAAVAARDPPLHRRRAGERPRGAREGDHQPVAQVLYLLAARFGDRLAEDPEVLESDFLGDGRADPKRHLSASDEVGEQHRHGLHGVHPSIRKLAPDQRLG